MTTMVTADWSRLEQKFEDGFEKLYKLLGLPFERNEVRNADFSAENNSYRSENSSNTTTSSKNPFLNTTTKSEGKQSWNSSRYVLVNDQTMEENDEPVQQTPSMDERKVEAKDAESIPSVRLIASESKPKKEVKTDEVTNEGLVMIDSEEFTNEAWEAIADALKVANILQQKAETEHLLKALLEQNQGLVPHVLTEVSIDPTLLLKITSEFINSQPKNMDESGSVFGPELKALLHRAKEWKEEYGDSSISIEHLLLGFNLDNRIGKYVYKEGKSFDIALNILDAIEVLRKSPQKNEQEEKHDMGEYNANTEIWMETGIAFREFEHSWIHLNNRGLDWTNANSVVKDLIIWSGPLVGSVVGPTKINLYLTCEITNNAHLLFDEMSSRWDQCFGKARTLEFFTSRKFNLTMELLKKMKKKNVIAWTSLAWHVQSGGPNLVKFLQEMQNASTNFSPRRIDHDWWGYDFVVVLVRETLAIGQLEKEWYASPENIHRLKVQDVMDKVNMWAPYLPSKPQITRNLVQLEDLNSIIGYAIKVKNNFQILKHLRKLGCGVVLVNSEELRLVLLPGFDATRCVFNRNRQLWEDLVLAVQEGVPVNVDSELNLDNIVSAATARNKGNVLVQINSDVLVKAHCHLESTTTKVDIFRDVAVLLVNYIDQIRSQVFETDHLSISSGLEIDFYHIGVILPAAQDLIEIVHELVLLRNLKVIIGPRKLVRASTCCVVLCDSIVSAEVTKKTQVFVFDPGGSQSRKEGPQGQLYKGWLRNGSTGLVKCLKIITEAYTFHLTAAYGSKGVIQRAILEDKDV